MTIALTFEKSTYEMNMALTFKTTSQNLYRMLILRAQREHLLKILKISSLVIFHSEFGSELTFENIYKMHFPYHPRAA